MSEFNGPNPEEFTWEVSGAKQVLDMRWSSDGEPIEEAYNVSAWNLPKEGQRYAEPDVRVRCYIIKIGGVWRCEVHMAWGVSAGMPNPNPELFRYNEHPIAESFERATGCIFPHGDIRLNVQAMQWTQIGAVA